MPKLSITGVSLSLLLLCSWATENSAATHLPGDVPLNKDAGRGGFLVVTLQLNSGEKLPFILDTGASGTCFDKSLEPKLGKRLGTATSRHFGTKGDAGIYSAPELYLGRSPLMKTGTNVATLDLKHLSYDGSRPILGILGIDVLEHYCIQLDFAANRMRFLDADHVKGKNWGKPFSLTNLGDGCFAIGENLVGGKSPGSLIDTGCDSDGWLTPALFQQWTNQAVPPEGGQARSPNGLLGADTYGGLDLDRLDEAALSSDDSHVKLNIIGLRLLARHLVTLDFPNRTMYLKRISPGPLASAELRAAAKAAGKSAVRYLERLKKKGQLPGWSKANEFANRNETMAFRYPGSATFDHLQKKGDSSVYHYVLSRNSIAGPWKLQKAWRTDQNGHAIEEYVVP